MRNEQLSFLEQIEKQEICGADICNRCCCNECKYSVEIYPSLTDEECKEIKEDSCFNCDECYYYGMDDKNLSRHVVKFQCEKYEISNYYADIEAKNKRKKFKIISS